MENMYPHYTAPISNPAPLPAAQHPAHMMPYLEPQVNVYNVNYLKPAPAYVAPAFHHPVHHARPFATTTGVILVLFILLVIVSRASHFGGKY